MLLFILFLSSVFLFLLALYPLKYETVPEAVGVRGYDGWASLFVANVASGAVAPVFKSYKQRPNFAINFVTERKIINTQVGIHVDMP